MFSFLVIVSQGMVVKDSRFRMINAPWKVILSDKVPAGVAYIIPKIDPGEVSWWKCSIGKKLRVPVIYWKDVRDPVKEITPEEAVLHCG